MSSENTDLIFILDKSGSMAGIESDTIGGFNSMLKKQKSLMAIVSLQQFYLIMIMNYFMNMLILLKLTL